MLRNHSAGAPNSAGVGGWVGLREGFPKALELERIKQAEGTSQRTPHHTCQSVVSENPQIDNFN